MMDLVSVQGKWMDLEKREKWVGIIGSRMPSEEEKRIAYAFARQCAKKGYIVVSGLAKGIDAEAHRGALAGGGRTIAIVNTPISQGIYPSENKELAAMIVKNGCILHPFDLTDGQADALHGMEKGMKRFQKRLIERNLLLAYTCPKIVAVKEKDELISGGTKWAMNYGDIFEKGTFRLDAKGILHPSPRVQKEELWWKPEMEMWKEMSARLPEEFQKE